MLKENAMDISEGRRLALEKAIEDKEAMANLLVKILTTLLGEDRLQHILDLYATDPEENA